jgi:NADH/NAD ratio-sensing transcriptional regulator Rex
VFATDLDDRLVGQTLHGVKVEHGAKTYSFVEDVDVAIITGMTLTTDSITDIMDTAKRCGTRVLMFAETGANMGEEYTSGEVGVDICVSEPFPFYIFQGLTTIEVYRAKWVG